MTKIHELIAIEKDVKKTSQAIIGETGNTFHSKKSHFEGSIKTFQPRNDEEENTYQDEVSHTVTSVKEKLEYFNPYMIKLMDIISEKENANCGARGDIQIDNDDEATFSIIAENVPVQALVQYEKILEQIKAVYLRIPTNDPKYQWSPDESKGDGYWRTGESKRRKTRKIEKLDVVVQATDKFPAQVAKRFVDEFEGNWIETKFSGMMSPLQKSQLLERLEKVIAAIKMARSRANLTDVANRKISRGIFDYIMG